MTSDLDRGEVLRSVGFREDGLADLSSLGLSAEALAARRNFIGGSDATIICSEDEDAFGSSQDAILALWQFKRGEIPPNDLSHLIYVQLANWTEPFLLAWGERTLGVPITRRGERVFSKTHPFMAATLDGWIDNYQGERLVVQVKHVNAFSKIDEIVDRYYAQLQHEALATGADAGLLIVLIGTMKLHVLRVPLDLEFAGHVVERELEFWSAVQSGTPPTYGGKIIVPPESVSAFRTAVADMDGREEWMDAAARWRATRDAALEHRWATETLKGLMPETAKVATGGGVVITATKAGAKRVSIEEDTL